MNLASGIAAKIANIFAASGVKNTIPATTAGVSLPNNASFDVGFSRHYNATYSVGWITPNRRRF